MPGARGPRRRATSSSASSPGAGMGAILQGRDVDLGRDLAVKVLLEEHRDHPEMVRRFVEEAQIGGQLQHPGIVPVYELGRLPDGRLYIAMKLVRGRTLAALLEARAGPGRGPAAVPRDLRAGLPDDGLRPRRGVIHRDLKPSNVMVGSFGEVQVMDWGLAKVLDQGGVADEERAIAGRATTSAVRTLRSGSEAIESRAGSVLGTPSYMAPEQARGELDTLDERADVFGLGSILCEILTGQPAFAGETGGGGLPQGGAGRPGRGPGPARRLRRRRRAGGAGAVVPRRRAEAPAAGRGGGRRRADGLPRRRRGAAPGGRAGPGQGRGPRRRGAQAAPADARPWRRRCSRPR